MWGCVCLHVCRGTCVCGCANMHVWVYKEARKQPCNTIYLPFVFKTASFTGPRTHQVTSLAGQWTLENLFPPPLCWGYKWTAVYLLWVLGLELMSPCLQGKQFRKSSYHHAASGKATIFCGETTPWLCWVDSSVCRSEVIMLIPEYHRTQPKWQAQVWPGDTVRATKKCIKTAWKLPIIYHLLDKKWYGLSEGE